MSRHLAAVDRIGVERRAAELGRRSIKHEAKAQGIRLAVSMVDLTTLEGKDTDGKVAQLCAKAVCPDPSRADVPSCAAVCVYPAQVPAAWSSASCAPHPRRRASPRPAAPSRAWRRSSS